MKFCEKCGAELLDNAIMCPKCGNQIKKQQKPVHKKWWFWVIIVFAFFMVVGVAAGNSETSNPSVTNPTTNNTTQANNNQSVQPSIPKEFSEKCPVSVSANIEDNIIGVPEITCTVKNNSDKEIAAVEMYVVPVDVYGEEINTIFTTNKLYTNDAISSGSSKKLSYQLLDQNAKSGDLYVYSVYFSDGSYWGDRDASSSKIKKYGMKISVND